MPAAVLARFQVEDYSHWRERFEANGELRRTAGCLGTHVFRNTDNPNDVTVNFQWDTEDNARKFLNRPNAQEVRAANGVISTFDYWFVEDAGRTPS